MSFIKALKMNKAIILDRDGTLTDDEKGYTYKIEDFKLMPGVVDGLSLLSKEYIFVVITNQSGIGRGVYTEEDMHRFNEKMVEELNKSGLNIKKVFYCTHSPEENCECRKPKTKYMDEAKNEFDIDLKSSWTIGDHPSDIELAARAGTKAVYLLTGHGRKHFEDLEKNNIRPNFIAENFLQAANFIAGKKI
jgi:D-glycero-D-manno-heptose 1,7-bisphosphate phosphatase